MKIYYLSKTNIFYENSASANRARSLLEGLEFLGVEICLLLTGGFISNQEIEEQKLQGFCGSRQVRYLTKLRNDTLMRRRINKYLLFPILKPYIFRQVRRIIESDSNVILWTGCELNFFKFVVYIKKKRPAIFTFTELSEYLNYQQFNKGNFFHRLSSIKRQAYFERTAFYKYDSIALMTRTLLNHYSKFPDPKPGLIHLPMTVDFERFKSFQNPPEGFIKPYLAFIGMMNDAKDGVNILIQSFATLACDYKELKLYLVGGWGYDTPSHLELIRDFNLEDRIFWKGEFHRDLIPSIIMNATLLVLPRPDTKQTQWGFPTKLGEYLATGNPVCVTRIGEIPDYLVDDESVYFSDPNSVESFANSMRNALSNYDKAKQIGLNGLVIAKNHFDLRIQSERLFQFFSNEFNIY